MDENKPPQPKLSFLSRNMVMLVMIPGLAIMHFGWLWLQTTPAAKSGISAKKYAEEPKLPTTDIYDKVKARYFGGPSESK